MELYLAVVSGQVSTKVSYVAKVIGLFLSGQLKSTYSSLSTARNSGTGAFEMSRAAVDWICK